MEEKIGTMLRDALDVKPSVAADAQIRLAIRAMAASRRRRRRLRVWAAAAALAFMLGGGIWQLGRQDKSALSAGVDVPRAAVVQGEVVDEGEIMLEIIGLAEPVELEAFQLAQL